MHWVRSEVMGSQLQRLAVEPAWAAQERRRIVVKRLLVRWHLVSRAWRDRT